ncbi:MAG TPA: flagellar biosynthetic protein FliR, partial [Planctomycetota bacterium]|nr:flagellar biosynthetic protein FliR [Planctomycetota bacterium]
MDAFTRLGPADLPLFLLTLCRVSGLMIAAPVFGSPMPPAPVKAFLALALSALVFPLAKGAPLPADAPLATLALAAAGELAVGLALGFAAALLFAAVQYAGQVLDQELGVGQAGLLDPFSDGSVAALAQFKVFLATVVYLLLDGHHFLVAATADSFRAVPLLAGGPPAAALEGITLGLAGDVFRMGLQIAAPPLATVFLVTAAFGFVSRAVPEMSLFGLIFPLRLVLG